MTVTDIVSGSNLLRRPVHTSLIIPTKGSSTPILTAVGENPLVFGNIVGQADSNGISISYTTNVSVNSRSGWSGDIQYMRALNIQSYIRFRINHRTGVRIFIGFSDQTGTVMTSSDSPAGQYYGLWLSSTHDNTQWYILKSDGLNSPVAIPLGLSADANFHHLFLRLYSDGSSAECQIQIDDNTFNGDTTNIPANTDLLGFIAMNVSLDGAGKNFNLGKVSIEQDY